MAMKANKEEKCNVNYAQRTLIANSIPLELFFGLNDSTAQKSDITIINATKMRYHMSKSIPGLASAANHLVSQKH